MLSSTKQIILSTTVFIILFFLQYLLFVEFRGLPIKIGFLLHYLQCHLTYRRFNTVIFLKFSDSNLATLLMLVGCWEVREAVSHHNDCSLLLTSIAIFEHPVQKPLKTISREVIRNVTTIAFMYKVYVFSPE